MEKIRASVIVPTYNIEEYIENMLRCAEQQTYRNFEVIVVDDGSTDSTLEKVQAIAAEYDNIRVIAAPHAGVSAARNRGINECKGSKIFFWDGDDTMEPNLIESCLKFAEEQGVKAVAFGSSHKKNGIIGTPRCHELKKVYRDKEIVTELMPHFIGHSYADLDFWTHNNCSLRKGKELTALWRFMIDAETVRRHNLRFDTNLSVGEDTRFTNEYLLCEESVGFLDECLYYLTIRETGANRSALFNAEKRMNDKIKLIEARLEIDKKAETKYGINTHKYWEGTLVFSAIELAILFSKNKNLSIIENYRLYRGYLRTECVKNSIKNLRVSGTLKKTLPFRLLKCHCQLLLFLMMYILPMSVIEKTRT